MNTTAMELGIRFVNFDLPGGTQALGPTLAATARAAEQGGALPNGMISGQHRMGHQNGTGSLEVGMALHRSTSSVR
jgi:hypothetical protein